MARCPPIQAVNIWTGFQFRAPGGKSLVWATISRSVFTPAGLLIMAFIVLGS